MKILIVDDEMVSRKKMEILLREYGECHSVGNGNEAIVAVTNAIAGGAGYELITLDITLPDMDGTSVLSMIRNLEAGNGIPDDKRAKVLMVTAHSDQQTVTTCIEAGCDDYIVKPFTLEHIAGKLKKFDLLA